MHGTIMSVNVIHPDGRTQDVGDYVTEIVLGAQNKAQKAEEEQLIRAVRKYVHGVVRDVLANISKNISNSSNVNNENEKADAGRTRVSFDCGDTPRDSQPTDQQDPSLAFSPTTHRYSWTSFTRLFKREVTKSSPKHQSDDERRGLFHFLKKRKCSEESTFTPDNLSSDCSGETPTASSGSIGRSPKKQKSRLMSDDSGIAVEDDSDVDNRALASGGRLSRMLNSFRNILFCASSKAEEI